MAQQDQSADLENTIVDDAVASGGAYDIIRKRLLDQGKQLKTATGELNYARLEEFGGSEMNAVARVRVRTEHNSLARDISQVGQHLVFGYNVFIGLKKETRVEDVFSLFTVQQSGDSFEIKPVPLAGTFLAEPSFVNDFDELYRYYKQARLLQIVVRNGKFLAEFQIGERLDDTRVFRWSVSADGSEVKYIDNRGERDIQLPPAYDFEWQETTREDSVNGRHPHINILDQVFVETLGGDLTIKVENNTEDGLGIYREPVEDDTQSLDDAQILYAKVGDLILLKICPYQEEEWRYLIFNTLSESVVRVDAIGQSCVQLPEDHGIIFPGGYYLQTGEYKLFDEQQAGLRFKRTIKSPNGEDVLYVFYDPDQGTIGLFAYNLIEKALQNPMYGHGYALAEDGRLVIFSAEAEPTRVHPMQVWQTPYQSAEFASNEPTSQSFYGRIGNAELVRGVSDLYSICRLIDNQSVSSRLYQELSQASRKIFDTHYWLDEAELKETAGLLREVSETAELVIDEFEKVESIRRQSAKAMVEAEHEQSQLLESIQPENWLVAEEYVEALGRLRCQRGHLITIKEYRYIDTGRIDEMEQELQNVEAELSDKTVDFLSAEESLQPYLEKIDGINADVEKAETIAVLTPLVETIENTASGLDLLSELMGTLIVQDATVHTRIIDAISSVYSKLNQSKAAARHKQKSLGSAEAVAQFSAQFKLFSQSITNALGLANTPERCDEQLSRLLVQLEELESHFSDYDQFLSDIVEKREEVYESFENHKQQLLDERQCKAQSITDAADRILASIERRSLKFTDADELNTYFASDALVVKVREQVEKLRDLDSAVKADDIESRFKATKEQALRSLRDKSDIYEDGGNVIKLGSRHKFSVNTQELDLTIIPRNGELNVHLTGTDYYEQIDDPELVALKDFWEMSLESETLDIYRGEYLAYQILLAAQKHQQGLSMDVLNHALSEDGALDDIVRQFAAPRYKDGYEKGVHDYDATQLLKELLPALDRSDLLRYDPLCRGLAQVFWANNKQHFGDIWPARAQSAAQMQTVFASDRAVELLVSEAEKAITDFIEKNPIEVNSLDIARAASYLVAELGRDTPAFIGSRYANRLVDELKQSMNSTTWKRYQATLGKLQGQPAERWKLTTAWLQAVVSNKGLESLSRYIPEAVALINSDEHLERRPTEVDTELTVERLLGSHPSIADRQLSLSLDSFLLKAEHHCREVVPAYHRYLELRQEIITRERNTMRLEEFKPRPLSSFVRNRLINESYLPLIGDNLAKQMGTVGENKRTDLMGLLMMISPPGYGKTTLMEYVANRLGLIFMKINCPSLGHDVLSLDPAQAPNATARQELEKLNLALEMGNNVMLYLDDIQHTHPEFLQKFISLCDGTRRVEGVWRGNTKTYDMRGRKFCVIMAGNPYTESGEAFKVPDMLANRADIYNLGDILGGMDEQFALSYIENSITSNPVLAPMAVREMEDIYKLIAMAKGESIATTDLSHQYSGAEINEITDILKKLFVIQDVVLKINQQYIASAAQNDKYRTEPSFKLQGSYRNMNKMTEKVSAVMNDDELMQMIADHYLGEAQLLTTGAEDNLLKLAELRGNITDEQGQRWEQIKADFLRNKKMGGDGADTGGKVVAQLADLVKSVESLSIVDDKTDADKLAEVLEGLTKTIAESKPNVEVINQPVPGIDNVLTTLSETVDNGIVPLIKSVYRKLDIDLFTHEQVKDISEQLAKIETDVGKLSKSANSAKKAAEKPKSGSE